MGEGLIGGLASSSFAVLCDAPQSEIFVKGYSVCMHHVVDAAG